MANFAVPQETSQLGRTSPIAMSMENSPQEVRMPLAEEISMRIRTVWDMQATQLTPGYIQVAAGPYHVVEPGYGNRCQMQVRPVF
jgi:hypothetical protein